MVAGHEGRHRRAPRPGPEHCDPHARPLTLGSRGLQDRAAGPPVLVGPPYRLWRLPGRARPLTCDADRDLSGRHHFARDRPARLRLREVPRTTALMRTKGTFSPPALPGRWGREDGNLVRRRPCPGDELGHLCSHDRSPELRGGEFSGSWTASSTSSRAGSRRRGLFPSRTCRGSTSRAGRSSGPRGRIRRSETRTPPTRDWRLHACLESLQKLGINGARRDRRGRYRVLGVPAGRGGRRKPARGARAEDHRQRPAATGRHTDVGLRDRQERGVELVNNLMTDAITTRRWYLVVVDGLLGRPPGPDGHLESRPGPPLR